MTEEENAEAQPEYRIEDDPDHPDKDDFQPADFALQDVLDYTFGAGDEAPDGEMNLTAIVQGVVVSGIAVTREAWIQGMTLKGGDEDGTVSNALRKLWTGDVENTRETRARREAAKLPQFVRKYLYLKDTKIMPAGGVGIINAGFFRVRLADIGGWTIGMVGDVQEERD